MSEEAQPQLILDSHSDWEAEHFRLTCFVQEAPQPNQNWWERICGSSPESTTIRMKGVHRVDQGKFGPGIVVLEIQPGRIDLVLSAFVGEQVPVTGFPVVGPHPKALIEFDGIVSRWLKLDDLPPIQRMAFGVSVYMSVDSLKTGYVKLASYLKNLNIPENSSDFSYQINRPRKALTQIHSLSINRLSKWSVARLRIYSAQLDTVRTLAAERYACRLELDINTVPEGLAHLPKEMLPALFSELVALATEIMSKGDIA